jgi:GTP-binding protein
VGRSNVGKSSLLNALMRRPLARTSAAPGKTRLANFYRVQRGTSRPFVLVDLPGYGYARGGDASAREFNKLTEAYFARASGLGTRDSRDTGFPSSESRTPAPESRIPIAVVLLVDSRHPGLESDLQAWQWLTSQPLPHGVIATKADKLSRAERARHMRKFETLYERPVPLVSAQTGEGLDELWKMIANLTSQTAA